MEKFVAICSIFVIFFAFAHTNKKCIFFIQLFIHFIPFITVSPVVLSFDRGSAVSFLPSALQDYSALLGLPRNLSASSMCWTRLDTSFLFLSLEQYAPSLPLYISYGMLKQGVFTITACFFASKLDV